MEAVWTWVAALLTLCVFSFLWRDNPLYRFAEHLMVGVTGGYLICLAWFEVIKPLVWMPLVDDPGNWLATFQFIPLTLMALMLFRLGTRTAWLSRIPLAFMVGFFAGVQIPQVLQADVLRQVESTVAISFTGGWAEVAGQLVLVFGCLAGLVYFFFSRPHSGVLGGVARVGQVVLMAGFGASFGYTVMARISLLIGRVLFLLRDWLEVIA